MRDSSIAVLLTRAQPFTLGHEKLVKLMLDKHEHVCVVIGSADKQDTKRNPFKASVRFYQVCNILKKYTDRAKDKIEYVENQQMTFNSDRITIFALNDWESEDNTTTLQQWGSYLYYNIVGRTGAKDLCFYSSEEKLQIWFNGDINSHVDYVVSERSQAVNGVISATKAREELLRIYHSDSDYMYGDIFDYLSHDIDLDKYGIFYMSSKMRQIAIKDGTIQNRVETGENNE